MFLKNKSRRTPEQLDALGKFLTLLVLVASLGIIVGGTMYALIFVTQPVTGQSENDKLFFGLMMTIATFLTATLANQLGGKDFAKDMMKAQLDNKEMDAKNTQADKKLESELEINELKADVEADAVRARLDAKPNDQMPAEQPVDTDWDKD
jgi:hypothetical protein